MIAAAVGFYGIRQERGAIASTEQSPNVAQQKTVTDKLPEQKKPFDKNQFSIDDPKSPWVVVNKKRALNPAHYAPSDLTTPNIPLRSNITSQERQVTAVTARALESLVGDAKEQGIGLTLESGYRSYSFQENLYSRYVRQQGQFVADTQSARAGHSEHQTGLTADLGGITQPACNVEPCYADTPEGRWVAANAHKYGFIVRYPKGKTAITGYMYEPWHVRYVGIELSTEMHSQGIATMEEFFNLQDAADYN